MKLHHIAIVINSIEKQLSWYCEVYSAVPIGGKIFIDNNQKVKVQFIKSGDGIRIELLEPLNRNSPVKSHLDKYGSGSIYHVAYEVDNLDKSELEIRKKRGLITSRSRNGWNGMEVMFAIFMDGDEQQLIEYVVP